MKLIMIKYGELTTKGANRKLFINTLYNNIKNKISEYDHKIIKDRSRMYIETSHVEKIVNILKDIFGIHSIVVVTKVDNKDINNIGLVVTDLLSNEQYNTFKVRTNRADKNYYLNSMEISKQIGAYVLKNTNKKTVDVHNPEVTVNIDFRVEGVFIYLNEIEGSKGYPVGVGGKGLLMLSGGIDSPVSGYLSLKRGIAIDCIYFASPPHTSIEAQNKVTELVQILCKYSQKINLYIIPFTKIQETIYNKRADSYIITILRRMMYRISEKLAKKIDAKIIINGESIGQVASQTLDSISVINEVTNFPIIRPVACFDKIEIIDLAKKIGTYETSILPYEDCCTIFLPKNPAIYPKLDKVMDIEKRFDYETLIDEALANIEVIEINNLKNKNNNLL